MASQSSQDYPDLYSTCHRYPAIDHHAHPLLNTTMRESLPIEGLVSEAEGKALADDSISTLAFLRAKPQLETLYGLPDANWDALKAYRKTIKYVDLCRRCFDPSYLQCILFDDGLGLSAYAEKIPWHDQFTKSPSKRVVRIEVIAEVILCNILKPLLDLDALEVVPVLEAFNSQFTEDISARAQDDHVVCFKSIICYRTGLDVAAWGTPAGIKFDMLDVFKMFKDRGSIRLSHKALNDHVVRLALAIAGRYDKPVQFHTGLGDNDLSLGLASPSRLQPIIKAFPGTKFVLLHSSYPFTREAGYLTAVYSNVFLDFGEVFPFVSGQGQRAIIQQVLELTPTNKIMWSTDGHWWPESFYLSTLQARDALYQVLSGVVRAGELTEQQAVTIVQNALFHNANKLYKLNLVPDIQN